MNQKFSFNSSIKDVQNRLVSQSILQTSNMELLNSEEAIKNVLASYTDRFNALGGMLTDVSKYVVESKDVIKLEDFNSLFESMYIDLASLYNDLELVDEVLTLNVGRNKNYFSVVKKRIRDLWNKLSTTRMFIYDSNPSDESYYESFFTDINASLVDNILIDKKSGFMHLASKSKNVQNDSYLIKNVTTTSYPVNSDNGGARYSTSELNTYEDNYTNGPRDMLQNGLWKEEIITSDVPSMYVNIGSDDNPINREYNGISSMVDIEYTIPSDINRIDIDVFGDKAVLIDTVLYKNNEDDEWKVTDFVLEDPLLSSDNPFNVDRYSVRGQAFDVITLYNITPIKAKYLRIVFVQEGYSFLRSSDLGERALDQKIENDLSERRYDLVKFNSNYEEALATPVNDANTSLYNKIIDIIESTISVENILSEIEKILIPQVNVVSYDFDTALKFEIGAWSIEPIDEKYTILPGRFNSNTYAINDKALVSASIRTKQSIPAASTCNWYFDINGKIAPVIENDLKIRKEPINAIDVSNYALFNDWPQGTYVLLDFPIDPVYTDTIGLYVNGSFKQLDDSNVVFMNSRLLYINDIPDPYRAHYVIRYTAATTKSVNLYVLAIKTTIDNANKNIPLGIVSSRKEILQSFINDVMYHKLIDTEPDRYLKDDYYVASAPASSEEALDWFGTQYSNALFISSEVKALLDTTDSGYTKYSNVITSTNSKLSTTASDVNDYLSGIKNGPSNLQILSTVPNLAPLSTIRSI